MEAIYQPRLTDFMGDEKVTIHLTRPINTLYEIKSCETFDGSVCRIKYLCRQPGMERLLGTTFGCNVKVCSSSCLTVDRTYTGQDKPLKTYSSIGYRDFLQLSPENSHTYTRYLQGPEYNASVMDLSEILESNFSDKKKRVLHPMFVECVVEERTSGNNISRFHGCTTARKLEVLYKTRIEDSVRTYLPMELLEKIMIFMEYDQVSWLVKKNEHFTRLFAKRYNIERCICNTTIDSPENSDVPRLVDGMRKRSARKLHLRGKEDLWIASLDRRSSDFGAAKRYRMARGTYSWKVAVSVNVCEFSVPTGQCTQCQSLIADAQSRTYHTPWPVFFFTQEDAVDLDLGYSSLFRKDQHFYSEGDDNYKIHLWHEDLDNRWLLDMDMDFYHENLDRILKDFEKPDTVDVLVRYKTLIFKDPVKFFGSSKILHRLYGGAILGISSSRTGETLGYLVTEKEFRFVLPKPTQYRSYGALIGLTIFSHKLLREIAPLYELASHIFHHHLTESSNKQRRCTTNMEQATTPSLGMDEKVLKVHEFSEANLQLFTKYLFFKNEINLDPRFGVTLPPIWSGRYCKTVYVRPLERL